MQIQPTISAGAAASSVAQSTSKDRTVGTGAADSAAGNNPGQVEKVAQSEQSNADRDAQGAGPMGSFKKNTKKKPEPPPVTPTEESLPVKAPEPPSELDLIG